MSDPFNKLVMDFEDEIAQKQAEIERLTEERDDACEMQRKMFAELKDSESKMKELWADIRTLEKERDKARAMLVQTQLELLALKGEGEKDHRSFNEAAKFSTECIANLAKRVEELEKDNRRLDWLLNTFEHRAHMTQAFWHHSPDYVRETIDTAIGNE